MPSFQHNSRGNFESKIGTFSTCFVVGKSGVFLFGKEHPQRFICIRELHLPPYTEALSFCLCGTWKAGQWWKSLGNDQKLGNGEKWWKVGQWSKKVSNYAKAWQKNQQKRQNSVASQCGLDCSNLPGKLMLLSLLPGNTAIEQFAHWRERGILKTSFRQKSKTYEHIQRLKYGLEYLRPGGVIYDTMCWIVKHWKSLEKRRSKIYLDLSDNFLFGTHINIFCVAISRIIFWQ